MITNIKLGTNKIFHAECNDCKSDFDYEFSDIRESKRYKDDYDIDWIKCVVCPVCGEEIYT